MIAVTLAETIDLLLDLVLRLLPAEEAHARLDERAAILAARAAADEAARLKFGGDPPP